ncbi:response regulator transcription factor [Arthrobacter sp. SO3]|uniref:response regulator transcription factor n=1 Tax=Arthrobacter sp. SO3 TaxID=1897057 RepID=UPI001D001610|nr:response regulator transcription factor [Arthrobacter sp. SO3]MCB5294390.1 Response regulator MprA [Arthrobacter sp. SO3]
MPTSRFRVLVVDDDADIVLGIRTALEADGYDVFAAADGLSALSALVGHDPHAVILDLEMPLLDGLAVCRTMRATGDRTPVLVLTARSAVRDRIAGLDAGADDYLGKPFDLDELLARVRALLRRTEDVPAGRLSWNGLALDAVNRTLAGDGPPIQLTRIEAELLCALFAAPDRMHSRTRLTAAIWGEEAAPSSNALEVYISQVRRKLAEAGREGAVRNERGLGYHLVVK